MYVCVYNFVVCLPFKESVKDYFFGVDVQEEFSIIILYILSRTDDYFCLSDQFQHTVNINVFIFD